MARLSAGKEQLLEKGIDVGGVFVKSEKKLADKRSLQNTSANVKEATLVNLKATQVPLSERKN